LNWKLRWKLNTFGRINVGRLCRFFCLRSFSHSFSCLPVSLTHCSTRETIVCYLGHVWTVLSETTLIKRAPFHAEKSLVLHFPAMKWTHKNHQNVAIVMQTDALFHYGKYCKSAKWCYHGRSCDYEMATPFHLIDMTSRHFIKWKLGKFLWTQYWLQWPKYYDHWHR